MMEKQLEALEEKCRTYDVDEVTDYHINIWELDQFLPPRLTFKALNQIVMEEWKAMADSGWGEELFYRPIRTEKGEIYIGFWDTDNNDNLFIKTELNTKKNKCSESVLRSHISSCIIAVERGVLETAL